MKGMRFNETSILNEKEVERKTKKNPDSSNQKKSSSHKP